MLDSDIQEEDRKAGNPDPASVSYPMLALNLRARRANLQDTIATLERKFERHPELARAA